MLVLESYDKDIHQHKDDCDYVIKFDILFEEQARQIAISLGYGSFSDSGKHTGGMAALRSNQDELCFSEVYFLCHS